MLSANRCDTLAFDHVAARICIALDIFRILVIVIAMLKKAITFFNLRIYVVLGFAAAFLALSFGCGSSLMPANSNMHGSGFACTVFSPSTIVILQKDIGRGLASHVLFGLTLMLWGWVGRRMSRVTGTGPREYLRSASWRSLRHIHNFILQLISRGILHPKMH